MLLDSRIKDLVEEIERTSSGGDTQKLEDAERELVTRLRARLRGPEAQDRYRAYREGQGPGIGRYPIDGEGYAVAFDPLEDEEGFWNAWSRYGMVVGKGVVAAHNRAYAVDRMRQITRQVSGGACDLDDPSTWSNTPIDANGMPFFSRGFFEVYHDRALSNLRQSPRLYVHHAMIWGAAELWTSYDRLGVKLPGHGESYALPLHVDQNPLIHPGFKTVQGVVALVDCPEERGTFVGVPGSRALFPGYGAFAPERGEFVQLADDSAIASELKAAAQPIPLRAGDVVSWDSRTTHANTDNHSDLTRFVAYIAAGPAREGEPELVAARAEAFASGIGSNLREALMHASKKARYSDYDALAAAREPEQLSFLGRLLYGHERYPDA